MPKNRKFFVTCLVYGTAMLLLVTLQIVASFGVFSAEPDSTLEKVYYVLLDVLSQVVIMLLIPWFLTFCLQRRTDKTMTLGTVRREVHWGKISGENILLCVVLGFCLYLFNIFIASFFGYILQSFGYQYPSNDNIFHGWSGFAIMLLLTAVFPAICEEFLHRGLLLHGLIRQVGVHRAVLCVSLLFGLMHMNVGQFFFTTILGWFMCLAVLSAKSLWAGIIIHFINNGLSVYMSYAEELNLPGTQIINAWFANPLILVLTMITVLVVIGAIMRHMAQQNFEKDVDIYTVRYLASQSQFNTQDFDQVKMALGKVIKGMPTWKAVFAYVETFDQPKKMTPLAHALFVSVFFLGTMITVLSFCWGVM